MTRKDRTARIAVGLLSGYVIDTFTHAGAHFEIIENTTEGRTTYGVREAGYTQLMVAGRPTQEKAKADAIADVDSLNDALGHTDRRESIAVTADLFKAVPGLFG